MIKAYIADVSSLEDPIRFNNAYKIVDSCRQEKIDRFRFSKDKKLSLGAGLLLKKALEGEEIFHPKTVLTVKGKPYLKDYKDVFFSLSHSGTFVLCVIANFSVGCDIELIDKAPVSVIDRSFTIEEQAYLKDAGEEEIKQSFFSLWTGKESFLKLTGDGISKDLNSFSIKLPLGQQEICGRNVTFFEIPCGPDYKAAVCIEGAHEKGELLLEEISLKECF